MCTARGKIILNPVSNPVSYACRYFLLKFLENIFQIEKAAVILTTPPSNRL